MANINVKAKATGRIGRVGLSSRRRGGGGANAGSPSEIAERKEIGDLMSGWHTSMGDPVYAVGSFYVSGTPYPDLSVVSKARERLARDLQAAKRRLNGWGPKEVRELETILDYLSRTLGLKSGKSPDAGDLATMLRAYMTAALKTGDADDGRPLERDFSVDDFTREAVTKMRRDVAEFARANAADVGVHWSQAGTDFWLSRNESGTGFWDREEVYGEAAAKRLQRAAEKYNQSSVYVVKKKLYVD